MGRIDYVKILKISVGCCLGFLAARSLGLDSDTSAAVITLLSILNTRRDTLLMAKKRFLAFFCASLAAWVAFPLLGYSVLSLGLYLLLLGLLCQSLQVMEGYSMSTVLMLHIWKSHSFTLPQFLNELALMAIGILMAVLMNLYMPSRIAHIRHAQSKIEEHMRDSLLYLAGRLQSFCHASDPAAREKAARPEEGSPFDALQELLEQALLYARYTEDNGLFRNMGYYTRYVRMRMDQADLIRRIDRIFGRLDGCYLQTRMTASFMEEIAKSLHEPDNARELLDSLALLRNRFRMQPLPETRQEFESRAVLYEMVNDLQELLFLKHRFAQSLSPQELNRYWGQDGRPAKG